MDHSMQQNSSQFNIPKVTNPPPQIFGAHSDNNASPILPDFGFMDELPDDQDQDGNQGDSNEAKRRRIARVLTQNLPRHRTQFDAMAGVRYVPEEEDQM